MKLAKALFSRLKPTIDMASPAVHRDPYPAYAELRRKHPVYRDPKTGFWLVSRYADVANVLKDTDLFSSSRPSFERSFNSADAPLHARVRRAVGPMFSAARLAAFSDKLRLLAIAAIDRIAAAGACDLIGDLVAPIPLRAVAWTLEIEDARLDDIERWSRALLLSGPHEDIHECRAFMQEHMAGKQQKHEGGAISELVAAREDPLTIDELTDVGMLLLVAGTESATKLVGNAIILLARDPQLQQTLRSNPGLLPSFIEEVLRYDSPVQRIPRLATRPTNIAGIKIAAGDQLVVLIGSANRDPTVFPDADRFQIDRQPNNHLSFGLGPHFCIGLRLARLEAGIILEEMVKRLPVVSLASPQDIKYVPNFIVRGPERLDILFPSPAHV
jgi:cytochrome P450